MTIYLYVKTHNKTGLKYLGKTKSTNPHKYPGSGIYWISHLNKHGYDYSTEIIRECKTNNEIKQWGIYYSKLWDVVNSDSWANLKEETGDGVDSLFATKENLKRVANGTHPWLGGEVAKKHNQKMLENGTHPFLGGNVQRKTNQKRVENRTHLFLNSEFHRENNLKRLKDGTHNMLKGQLVKHQLLTGTHTSQKNWTCPHCNKKGKGSTNYIRWHGDKCSKLDTKT